MSGASGAGAPPPSGVVCNSVLSFVAAAQPTMQAEEAANREESGREGSQNERVPAGIKAICDACTKLYPNQPNPLQVTTRLKYWLGGEDPLDYISMYWNPGNPEENIPPHWHYITFGLSDLHGDGRVHTRGPVSGFGFELSFRLATEEKAPPLWPSALCQALAKYVFTTGNKLCPGDHVSWHRALDGGAGAGAGAGGGATSRMRHLLVARDPQLRHVHSPHGELQMLQIVGCTSRELRAAQRGSGFDVLKIMAEDTSIGPWHVTRMSRRRSVRVTPRGMPTLAGVSHPVWWVPIEKTQSSPERTRPDDGGGGGGDGGGGDLPALLQQQIKDTLQRGLTAMSAESIPTAGKMSTDSFEMSSIGRALPDVPGNIQRSWRDESNVHYYDSVHVFMNAEGATLLPLAIDGRVLNGSHFTWRGSECAVTLTASTVGGTFTTKERRIAATDTWLQVQITEEEAIKLSSSVSTLSNLCNSDSESESEEKRVPPPLPHTVVATGLTITVLPT